MKRIQEDFKLNDKKIEPTDVYLWATPAKMKLERRNYFWTTFPEQYVKAAVTNVEEDLASCGKRFPPKYITALLSNYAPWLEDLLELTADGVQQYRELIDQIRWAVRPDAWKSSWRRRCYKATLRCPGSGTLSKHYISLDI